MTKYLSSICELFWHYIIMQNVFAILQTLRQPSWLRRTADEIEGRIRFLTHERLRLCHNCSSAHLISLLGGCDPEPGWSAALESSREAMRLGIIDDDCRNCVSSHVPVQMRAASENDQITCVLYHRDLFYVLKEQLAGLQLIILFKLAIRDIATPPSAVAKSMPSRLKRFRWHSFTSCNKFHPMQTQPLQNFWPTFFALHQGFPHGISSSRLQHS